MSCTGYASRVAERLSSLTGVSQASVNFGTGRATVDYDPHQVSTPDLVHRVHESGFGVATAKAVIPIQGMNCASCVSKVEKAFRSAPGVLSAIVNLGTGRASADYLPSITSVSELRMAIESIGYQPMEAPEEKLVDREEEARKREAQDLRWKFGDSAILVAAVLMGSKEFLTPWVPKELRSFLSFGP